MKSSRNKVIVAFITTYIIIIIGFTQQPAGAQTTKIYENPEFGLKLSYPSDWTIGEEGWTTQVESALIIFLPPGKEIGDLPSIWIAPTNTFVSTNMKLEDIAYDTIQDLSDNKNFQLVDQGPITINGITAYGFSTMDEEGLPGLKKGLYIVMEENNTLYTFILTATSQEYSEILPIFQNLVTSAELTGIRQEQGNAEEFGEGQQGQRGGGTGEFNPFGQ